MPSTVSLQETELKAQELAKSCPSDAIDIFLQVLRWKKSKHGKDDPSVTETELTIAELATRVAQDLAHRGRHREMGRYIAQSKELTGRALGDPAQNARRLAVRAQTFNGLTCLAKSRGDVRQALKYCEKALSIMLHLDLTDQLPTCYLNVCALYSTLGLHKEALKHALLALEILREAIKTADVEARSPPARQTTLPALISPSPAPPEGRGQPVGGAEPGSPYPGLAGGLWPGEGDLTYSRLTMLGTQLAITYFNIAVEKEYLLEFPDCLQSYEVAIASATDFLGPAHPLTRRFRRALQNAAAEEQLLRAAGPVGMAATQRAKYQYCPTTTASIPALYKATSQPPAAPSGSALPPLPLAKTLPTGRRGPSSSTNLPAPPPLRLPSSASPHPRPSAAPFAL